MKDRKLIAERLHSAVKFSERNFTNLIDRRLDFIFFLAVEISFQVHDQRVTVFVSTRYFSFADSAVCRWAEK